MIMSKRERDTVDDENCRRLLSIASKKLGFAEKR
jgi:hypothetical protein